MRYVLIVSSLLILGCGHTDSFYHTRTEVRVPVEVDNIVDRGLGYYDACEQYSKKVNCEEAAEAYVESLKENSNESN